jgi:hypothetical protein
MRQEFPSAIISSMRCILAMLVLAITGFGPVVPLLLTSDAGVSVPQCCRRDGKHHCAMAATQPSSGPALQAGRCQFFPGAQAVPVPSSRTAVVKDARTVFAALVGIYGSVSRTEALCRISYSRAGQKRGPPLLFS